MNRYIKDTVHSQLSMLQNDCQKISRNLIRLSEKNIIKQQNTILMAKKVKNQGYLNLGC